MPARATFHGWVLVDSATGKPQPQWSELDAHDLPPGEVMVEVTHSAVNYKDALAFRGHPGIVKRTPQILGIDLAGTVLESASPEFQPGQTVLATSYGLGMRHGGGWAEVMRVPAEWIVPLPESISPSHAMGWGTAGLTAMLALMALERHGVTADEGEVLVTGATGGVGGLALQILADAGYSPVALTGKVELASWLQDLGAVRVEDRSEWKDSKTVPLRSARWSAAIDTVGGPLLGRLLSEIRPRGAVAACGNAGGDTFESTVYPWILRGISLLGIDSAECPLAIRREAWRRLASVAWRPGALWLHEIQPQQIPEAVDAMLAGQSRGRQVVVWKTS